MTRELETARTCFASALRTSALAVLCALLIVVGGCAGRPVKDNSLYQALGEQPGIEALVDRFLVILSDDLRIVRYFAETDISRVRDLLVEQFCDLSGGPCEYSGDTMQLVHEPMNLTEADFNALVEDLIDAMEDLNLPQPAQNGLLALLAPMHGDIVTE